MKPNLLTNLPVEGIVDRTVQLSLVSGVVLCGMAAQRNWVVGLSAGGGLLAGLIILWSIRRLVPLVLRPDTQEAAPAGQVLLFVFAHLLGLTALMAGLYLAPQKTGKIALLAGFAYPQALLLMKAMGLALFGKGKKEKAVAVVMALALFIASGTKTANARAHAAPAAASLATPEPGDEEAAAEVEEEPATYEPDPHDEGPEPEVDPEAEGEYAGEVGEDGEEEVVEEEVAEEEEHAGEEHAEEAHGEEDGHAAAATHGDKGHGDGHGGEHAEHHDGPPHVPTFFNMIGFDKTDAHKSLENLLGTKKVEPVFWYMVTIGLICLVMALICGKLKTIPGRAQSLVEMFVTYILDLVEGVIGPDGRKYAPFIGSLFVFILVMNLLGMVPGYYGPTANFNTTAALAIVVFLYAQYQGIVNSGLGNYLKHFLGEPLWLAPLMLPLHIVGEFIKPISLALRLFGNINGEHVLTAAFIVLVAGITTIQLGPVPFPLPLPVHFPLMLLGLLVSFIQALVFSLLAVIYIFLLLPHDHDHGHGEHGEAAHHH